jgi:DNA-binding transcriptional ArsR family regulator
MPLKTLQVAILGGTDSAVLAGLRNFPAHKLILIASPAHITQANGLSQKLTDTLKLAIEVVQVKDDSIPVMLDAVAQIIRKEAVNYEDFLINVGSAGKHSTTAGVTAAFLYGIKGFDVIGEQPEILPVMKFSYAQFVNESKMEILRAIERSGGEVESLEKLSETSNYGKPLLSYHIRGSEDGEGLEELGLVEVERGKRGRLRVRLTALGRILLSAGPLKQ